MSISLRVLGEPGRDNAALVLVNAGSGIGRILFDCGDACVTTLGRSEIQQIDHLCFSHLHMDHIGGFDSFFRTNFDCPPELPRHVYGPPETARILHHRFQGFLWNLTEGRQGVWFVYEVHPETIHTWRFQADEAFAIAHDEGITPHDGTIIATPTYTVTALAMDHRTPSLAYIVRETARRHVLRESLENLGLVPGPWLKIVKDREQNDPELGIMVDGQPWRLADLRAQIVHESPGEAVAYLTDFLLDGAAMERLIPALHGCHTVVCECQYRDADRDFAVRHHHMIPSQGAELARRAGIGALLLFHLSERYPPQEWRAMIEAARAIFPDTFFPEHWSMGGQ